VLKFRGWAQTAFKDDSMEIKGFRFSATAAGIKNAESDRLDLGLIVSDTPAVTAGVTTTNLVCAAPVVLTRQRLQKGLCSAVLMNSGNANSYTHEQGMTDALELTRRIAMELGIDQDLVIPMSTGVIGNQMPIDRISACIPDLVARLDSRRASDVAAAIMTTDTVPKTVVLDDTVSSGPVRMVGLAKGSGMIAPNMATMLAVIMTDMEVEAPFLKECLQNANRESFNRITVDGDMSTNDTLIVMAGGRPEAAKLGTSDSDHSIFASMLSRVCADLAHMIVSDGEGATKVIRIRVTGAPDQEGAEKVARTIAESPLVKTAFHGEDPNWGRIICAAGRAGVMFNPDRVDLFLGDVAVIIQGTLASDDWESQAAQAMKEKELAVLLDLKSGVGETEFLTTDLSAEYVRINADYRS
jgi:glutamate N-acetyltransferase/amino-acid N-acetyltransferase